MIYTFCAIKAILLRFFFWEGRWPSFRPRPRPRPRSGPRHSEQIENEDEDEDEEENDLHRRDHPALWRPAVVDFNQANAGAVVLSRKQRGVKTRR